MPTITTATRNTSAPHRPLASGRKLWSLVLEAVIGSIVVVLLLEGCFSLAGIGEQEYLRPNPLTGFSPIPGKIVTWRQEGFSRTVFNRFGMRERQITQSKPNNQFRIACLGDSYVEALQVDRQNSFCQIVEGELNSTASDGRFEVMNFGVSGYNIGQMYLRLKHLALSFQPDLVILALRIDQPPQLDADPNGGFIFARPTFALDAAGHLTQDDSLQKRWNLSPEGRRMKTTDWLREHSRLWGVLSTCAQQLSKKKSARLSAFRERPVEQQWPIAHALMAACNQICQKNGSRLMVVALPGPGPQHNWQQLKLMQDSARSLEISFLDLTPNFVERSKRDKDLFFVAHMTERGHRLAADQLMHFLQSEHLVPEKSISLQGTESIQPLSAERQ